jgi:hypothetical protein
VRDDFRSDVAPMTPVARAAKPNQRTISHCNRVKAVSRPRSKTGGKQHEMPAPHLLEHYIDAYVTAAGSARTRRRLYFSVLK